MVRLARWSIVLAGFFVAFGCASKGGQIKAPNDLTPIDMPAIKFVERWKKAYALSPSFSNKAWDVFDDTFFLAGKNGTVLLVNTRDGSLQKTLDTPLRNISVLDYDGEQLIIGNTKGQVAAIASTFMEDNAGGNEVQLDPTWEIALSGEILSHPLLLHGKVIVRTLDGKVYSLLRRDGSTLWSHEEGVPALTLRGTSDPVPDRDRIILGFDDGQLAVLEEDTGRPLWKSTIAVAKGINEVERLVDVDATPLVASDSIYASAYQARTVALASESGRVLWDNPLSSFHDMVMDREALYLVDNASHVAAIEKTTGITRWEQDALMRRNLVAPLLLSSRIVVGDFEGFLHALDSKKGTLLGRIQVARSAIILTTRIGETVLAMTADGHLAAYTLRTP